MNRGSNHTHGPDISQQLCKAVDNLGCEIGEAIERVMQTRSRNTPIVIGVIRGYQNIIEGLLGQAKEHYKHESEEAEIIRLAEKKTHQYLSEYDYYGLIADIFEQEKIIQKIQAGLAYLSNPEKTWKGRVKQLRLFFTFGITETQLRYQLQGIIGEIETVIGDAQFNGLEKSERELLEEKWKYYTKKVHALDIEFQPFSG